MPRIRSIRPSVWTDQRFAELSPNARLTLLGIVSALLDDEGRGVANPKVVRGQVYGMDDGITAADIEAQLTEIEAQGILTTYEVNRQRYMVLPEWTDPASPFCQKIDKPSKSLLPPPPFVEPLTDRSPSPRRAIATERSGAERSGEERSGAEREARRLADAPANGNGHGPARPRSHLDQLPAAAQELVAKCYLTSPTRQLEVTEELLTALRDPAGVKVKLPDGRKVRAKARDAVHLEWACRAVLEDPPRDRDKAVVLVLQKLTDAAPGPSATELAAEEAQRRDAEDERSWIARRTRALKWAKEHVAEMRELTIEAEREIPADGDAGRIARQQFLVAAIERRYLNAGEPAGVTE